jgi:hypothetical protein
MSSSRELDMLIHQELKESERLRAEIILSLNELSEVLGEYEIYRGIDSGSRLKSFNQFIKQRINDSGNQGSSTPIHNCQNSKMSSSSISIAPYLMSTAHLLNKLGKIEPPTTST